MICRGESIKLITEVVSSNWQSDYAHKAEDYTLFGVPEYWIVDSLGLGGRDYIGTPQQPTLMICTSVGDWYQRQLLRSGDSVHSPTFSHLQLTVDQILAAGQFSQGST